MTVIVAQNGTIYNISNFEFITIENVTENDEEKFGIVVNQTYIVGYYDTEEQAIKATTWIASEIGKTVNPNVAIIVPTAKALEEAEQLQSIDIPISDFTNMLTNTTQEGEVVLDDNTTNVQEIQ